MFYSYVTCDDSFLSSIACLRLFKGGLGGWGGGCRKRACRQAMSCNKEFFALPNFWRPSKQDSGSFVDW